MDRVERAAQNAGSAAGVHSSGTCAGLTVATSSLSGLSHATCPSRSRVDALAGHGRDRVQPDRARFQPLAKPLEATGVVEGVELIGPPPTVAWCGRRRRPQRLTRLPWKEASSRHTTSKSSIGSRPVPDERSTTCTKTFVRSRWLRKRTPRPWPAWAPSMSPGTSASTKLRSFVESHDAQVRSQGSKRVVSDLGTRS